MNIDSLTQRIGIICLTLIALNNPTPKVIGILCLTAITFPILSMAYKMVKDSME